MSLLEKMCLSGYLEAQMHDDDSSWGRFDDLPTPNISEYLERGRNFGRSTSFDNSNPNFYVEQFQREMERSLKEAVKRQEAEAKKLLEAKNQSIPVGEPYGLPSNFVPASEYGFGGPGEARTLYPGLVERTRPEHEHYPGGGVHSHIDLHNIFKKDAWGRDDFTTPTKITHIQKNDKK